MTLDNRNRNILYAAVVVLALLVGAEVSLRTAGAVPESIRVDRLGEIGDPEDDVFFSESGTDPASGFFLDTAAGRRLRPNATLRIARHTLNGKETAIVTNEFGCRSNPVSPKGNRVRLLVVGDSVTLGAHLPEEDSFGYALETASQKDARPMQVLNASVPGSGIRNKFAILREMVRKLRPDLVIVALGYNDVMMSPLISFPAPPSFLAWSWLAQHFWQRNAAYKYKLRGEGQSSHPRDDWNKWKEQLVESYPADDKLYAQHKSGFHKLIIENFPGWGSFWSNAVRMRIMQTLLEIRRFLADQDTKMLLLLAPVKQQLETDYVYSIPQAHFEEFAKEAKIPFLDLLEPLRESPQHPDNLYVDSLHWSVSGTKLVAEKTHAFSLRLLLE